MNYKLIARPERGRTDIKRVETIGLPLASHHTPFS